MSVYTVSQVNSYIQRMFCEDFLLRKLTVSGEVSGCKYYPSGQIYFNLKDETSLIKCVMFSQNVKKLRIRLENGSKVRVTGQVRIYEKAGYYELVASEAEQDGLGELFLRFEQLKRRLAESGMFDDSYKQPIPKYIRISSSWKKS